MINYLLKVNFQNTKFSTLKILYFWIIVAVLCALNTPLTADTIITIILAFEFHVFIFKFIANSFNENNGGKDVSTGI